MNTLKISCIQTNLFWEDKTANLEMFGQKILSITQQPHIVVLPEMFNTGFSMGVDRFAETMEGPTVSWMRTMAMEKKIILTGSLMLQEEGKFYNRMIWMLPTGEYTFYDKRHLFAYAGEDQYFTAGKKKLIVSVNGWRINLQVCYDLRFPVWARQWNLKHPSGASHTTQETPAYDLLLNVANWPASRSLAWKTLLCARAIENQCYVIGVNRVGTDGNGNVYTGDSSVFDALGQNLYQKSEVEDVFTVLLEKSSLVEVREKFPFWKDGDAFQILA